MISFVAGRRRRARMSRRRARMRWMETSEDEPETSEDEVDAVAEKSGYAAFSGERRPPVACAL